MTDYEEAAERHAREVAAMSDEEVAQELEAAGVNVDEVRARFRAMRSPPKRPRRLFFLAAAAALLVALLAAVFVSLSSTPPPIAPIPNREPTPMRVVDRHEDLVSPQGDAGQQPLNLPALPPR